MKMGNLVSKFVTSVTILSSLSLTSLSFIATSRRPAQHKIRLVGGSSRREGRIEVYTQEKWGTVCDDSFGNNDGLVVCKTLGFNRVVSVRTQAYFGQGTGSIVMDEVACSGSESSIFECSYSSSHDCSHSEDAGVQCA